MITDKISPWIARLILLIMAPIGAGTIWLTRKYGHESLETLALSESAKLVRQVSIDVLLSSHIGLVLVIALLPGKKFRAWRVALALLAFGIWGFDGVGMYAARYGIMDKANTTLESAADRYKTKKQLIEDLQASAKERRAQADREWANIRFKDAIKSRDMASKESADAVRLQKELDLMPDGAGTSEVRTFGGQENAMWRAISEAALVSLVLVAAFALIGLMLREVLHSDVPAAEVRKPDAPAKPAPGLFVQLMRWCGWLVGGGAAVVVPAHAAPAESSRPAAPAKPAPAAPVCTPADADLYMPAPAPSAEPAKPASTPAAPKQAQPVAPKQVQDDAPEVQAAAPIKRARKAAPAVDSARADTGVVGDVAGRYTRAKDAVEGRKCAPSQGGIRKFLFDAGEGCNQDVAIKYLEQMAKEGLIEPNPNGRGWRLKGVKS